MKAYFPASGLSRRQFVSAAGLSAMAVILAAPGVANRANAQANGFRELWAKSGTIRLRGPQRAATPLLAYEDVVPGPTIRVKRGQELKVRLANALSEPTLIHWHGMRLPNAMDGTPYLTQTPVEPGQSFDYRFVAKDAGTFWYHAPAMGQVERGLSGPLIVDEVEPPDVDRDVLLVFDDWHLNEDGSLRTGSERVAKPGETLFTANGQNGLTIPARRAERIRLRLVNATTSRLLSIGVPGQVAWVMAIDGQPAEPFVARDNRVLIAPGNRIDLFVDLFADAQPSPVTIDNAGQTVPVARFVFEDGAAQGARRGDPRPLPQNPMPSRIDLRNALRLNIPLDADLSAASQLKSVDGKKISKSKAAQQPAVVSWTVVDRLSASLGSPLFSAKRDRPISLAFVNSGTDAHVIHVHGHAFRLLDSLDDGWKPFWLDTLLVPPQQTSRIAFLADSPGKWAIERRSLSEPARESLTWFEVS